MQTPKPTRPAAVLRAAPHLPRGTGAAGSWDESAVGKPEGGADEGRDEPRDDDDPFRARRGDQLRVEADHQAHAADYRGQELQADHPPHREREDPGDQGEHGKGVLPWVRLAVAVQREKGHVRAVGAGGFRHIGHPSWIPDGLPRFFPAAGEDKPPSWPACAHATAGPSPGGGIGAGLEVFIHAPYGINVASANNRIRIPSRKLLSQQLAAAAAVGAKGLIVHGGHVTGGVNVREGYDNWRKAVERIDRPVPLLIENTAGGDHAMARGLDAIGRLWDTIADFSAASNGNSAIGFCLDTCHTWAGGDDLATIVDRVKAITGRIDLVHCNNSRDEFGSGRDRHAPIESGTIDPAQLLDVVRAAGAPAVSETPDPAADITWLRAHLGAG